MRDLEAGAGTTSGTARSSGRRRTVDALVRDPGARRRRSAGRTLALATASAVDALVGTASAAQATGVSFTTWATHPTGASPNSVRTADFDGDGRPDVAVVERGEHRVTVLRNTGSGLERWAIVPTGRDPTELVVGDVDGDRRPDIVTSDQGAGRLTVLRNTGEGFEP